MSGRGKKPGFLVVGASGFLGDALMSCLEKLDHPAVGTQVSMKRKGLTGFDLKADRIAEKVSPRSLASKRISFGVVCASLCQIDLCRRERAVTRVVNVENTIRLIADLAALGIKPVFISSGFVFDGTIGYYTEGHARRPICEYGRHKTEVEEHLEKHVPGALILRLDKIVGDDPSRPHLLTEWHGWIRAGRPVTCIRGQIFAPTSVRDAAMAIVRACELGLSGTYHVANPEFFHREELALQFALAMGRRVEIVSKPLAEFDFEDPRPLKTYLDATKFINAAEFRFTPMRSVFASFLSRV
ncbi:MAG: sugar nucleotide-binding protein [Elusimicrobia bacterium]|nr:sugar nucleotide-binding protein [Elusimicrobiota bacterium]